MDVGGGSGPDLICIGAQKGGTRWFYDQLVSHPDFWMPPVKELHYFDIKAEKRRNAAARKARKRSRKLLRSRRKPDDGAARNPDRKRDRAFVNSYAEAMEAAPDLEAYASLFDDKGEQKTGDVTPGYSALLDDDIARLAARFPRAKIVFLAREPVDRLWSHCCMALRRNGANAPETVDPEGLVAFAQAPWVAERSYPSEIVRRWKRHLPPERFAVFFFDDLKADPAGLRARLLSFLDADPTVGNPAVAPEFNRKRNFRKIVMTDDIRTALIAHFSDELRRCAAELGGPAADWPARYGVSLESQPR